VITGSLATKYPAGNFHPALREAPAYNADFSLATSNPFHTGTYGPVGVNGAALAAATAGVAR
jgi:hypothetical protein